MAGKIYTTAIKIEAQLGSRFKGTFAQAGGQLAKLSANAGKLKNAKEGAAAFEQLERATRKLTLGEKVADYFAREATEAKKLSIALTKAGVDVTKLGKDTSQLTEEQRKMVTQLSASQRKLELFASGARLRGAAANVGGQIKSLFGDALKLGGAAVGAGVGMFALAKSTAEAGVDIEKTSKRLGVTTDGLQLLRGAAKKSDVDIDALDTGLGKLAINLGKVISAKKKGGAGGLTGNVGEIQLLDKIGGGGKAAASDPFKHLKLSAKDLAKLEPERQVGKIADAINKLGTHAEKSAAVVQIFGKGGLSMLPLIEKGSAGLEELFAQTRASGNLLSKETIENSKKFHLALLATEGSIGSVKNTLGAALLPVVTDVLGKFSTYVKENRGRIKEWAEKTAVWIQDKAIPALIKIGGEAKALGEKIIGLVEKGAKLVGGFGNLALVIGAIRLAPVAKSILDVGSASITAAVGLAKYVAAKWAAVAATRALNAANAAGGGGLPIPGGGVGGAVVNGAGNVIKGAFGTGALAAGSAAAAPVGVAAAALAAVAVHDKLLDLDLKGAALKRANSIEGALSSGQKKMVSHWYGGTSYEDVPVAQQAAQAKAYAEFRRSAGLPPVGPSAALTASPAGGQVLQFSPTYNVSGAASRKDAEKQLDDAHKMAKKDALDAVEAHRAKKRRLSYE